VRDKGLEATCLWIIKVKVARLISGCNALGEVGDSSARGHHHLWPRLHGDSGCNAIEKVVGGFCVVEMMD